MKIRVSPSLSIDDSDIEESFVRSSGPGGQNVNKLATAVQLRFDPHALPAAVRARLPKVEGARLTDDGIVLVDASRYRTQARNRADAIERLVALVRLATIRPRPRRPTKPTRASKVRRVDAKQRRGKIKQKRKPVRHSDDD
ncbi:MAG: alternative ribosome rescue aminoacyl-tRNA hydrolase ArfB [Candidatus Binatia bacterium]|nr:alternative ribosome rescue aminoacyl-tRNA hydrolase ArfB [Candidatus Binatia bacterium]